MRISSDNINFTSKIKLISQDKFNNKIKAINKTTEQVTYPWTIETLKKGSNLFTTNVMDCIVICLTNGVNALMAHLGIRDREQASRDGVKEFNIDNIEYNLAKNIDLNDKKLHGFIFGGIQFLKDATSGNTPQLIQIKNLFKKYKIPYSIIAAKKDVHLFGKNSLLYSQNEDTLFITNNLFNYDNLSDKQNEKELEIIDDNIVEYNLY